MRLVETEAYQRWFAELGNNEKPFVQKKLTEFTGHVREAEARKPGAFGHHMMSISTKVTDGETLFAFRIERLTHDRIVFGIHKDAVVLLGTIPFDKSHAGESSDLKKYAARLAPMVTTFRQWKVVEEKRLAEEARHGGKSEAAAPAVVDPAEEERKRRAAALLAKFGGRGNGGAKHR